MIRYAITPTELKKRIEKARPGWLAAAAKRTQHFAEVGDFDEPAAQSIWGDIKEVFMQLQHSKCAYCESRRESEDYGTIEHDVEHFRPKSSVQKWQPPVGFARPDLPFGTPEDSALGYHLIPYQPLNYATSCKVCNTICKGDRFPTAAPRDLKLADPAKGAKEKPYLLYPIGSTDTNPEELITFNGVSPVAKKAGGFDRDRALVVIEFFKLGDPKRKSLFRRRAEVIATLFLLLEAAKNAANPVDKQLYGKLLDGLTQDAAEHANCARSFVRLYQQRPTDAREFFILTQEYLGTMSP
jgi:hypothetical protein